MKLLKLEILNLASLDNPNGEVIDFEQGVLKDSNIFSIVGSTGSGKSTILDAICLALYNRAPRYPRKKGERGQKIEVYGDPDDNEKNRLAPTDCRNILTRGTKYGYSKLTFLANNGTVYRAEWSVKFATKRYEDVITSLYSISNVNGIAVETEEEWTQLPEIIGLDYDQFLRTVLIAQGTFSNFLNAKEEERYALLEKLIGNEDLYASIAAAIKNQKDAAVSAYNEVAANVAALDTNKIPENELQLVEERIKELEAEEEKDKEEKKLIDEALAWYVKEKTFKERIDLYAKDFTAAKEGLEAYKSKAEKLSLHDATVPAVQLYKDLQGAREDKANNENSLELLKVQLGDKESELGKKETEQKVLLEDEKIAKDEQQKQKPHIAAARLLIGELVGLNNAKNATANAVKDAEKAAVAAELAVKNNAEAIQRFNNELGQKQSALEDLKKKVNEQMSAFAAAVEASVKDFEEENVKLEKLDLVALQNEKTTADKELADLKDALRITSALSENRSQSLDKQKEQEGLQARNADIDKELESFAIDKLTSELEIMRKSYTLMTSENWEMHRNDLRDGDPCPLCGSTHHPYKSNDNLEPVVNGLSQLIAEKEADLKKQELSKKGLENEKGSNEGRIEACKGIVMDLDKVISRLEGEWAELKKNHAEFEQDGDKLISGIETAQVKSEKANKSLEDYIELNNLVGKLREKMEQARAALNGYKELSDRELQKAADDFTTANTSLLAECAKTEQLSEQLTARNEEKVNAEKALEQAKAAVAEKQEALTKELGDKNPDTFEAQLEQAVRKASDEVEKMSKLMSGLREDMKELSGRVLVAIENRDKADEKANSKSGELNAWLEQYNKQAEVTALTEEDVAALYSSTENWEEIRERQRKLTDDFIRAQANLSKENGDHEEHQKKRPEKSEEEFAARNAELAAKTNTELVETKARMQRHENAMLELGKLGSDLDEATQTKRDWEQINEAIGADGKTLRKIAQCYTLRFLIEHANVEIRKFNGRFELMQVKNSLGIRVIDHERADDIRDTTSLSGGETFIVSLGLALGLSALSSRNISCENLFIDEGFGTLDPEALATVIDSLAMLQSSQGKKVGVISHTNTMSERITTQISVVKKGNSGSSRIEICP